MRLFPLILVDSTNTYAHQLISEGLSEDALVYCSEQTAGRGQRGNNWVSRAGDGIYCSFVVFHKNAFVRDQFVFNMLIAVAVSNYLDSKGIENVKIKWPNDILVNNRKIAGLVIENSLKGDKISSSIVGVGLNLNQEWKEENFETPSTSLKMITGENYYYEKEVVELAEQIKKHLDYFKAGQYELISKMYHQNLYQYQDNVEMIIDNNVVNARLEGINSDGSASIFYEGESRKVYHPQARMIVKHS
jgi:BirA family biotin operon repressor/biotin-[acetyl-CoA-carboxylase] ligase